jgi:hypothetical protein
MVGKGKERRAGEARGEARGRKGERKGWRMKGMVWMSVKKLGECECEGEV